MTIINFKANVEELSPRETRDPDVGANAAGGPEPVPSVVINRSTVAELERRRILRTQATALMILAVGAVMTLIYFAKLILVMILISILLSFVLAPVVELLEKWRIHRAVGAFVAVALLLGTLGGFTYLSYNRAIDFAHDLPKYKGRIQELTGNLRRQAETISKTTETVIPATKEKNVITVKQESNWTDLVSPYASSVSEIVLTLTFVPFLVYFMLTWQEHVRTASVMLFKMESRNTAYVMLGMIAQMIRSFIVGNFLIGLFLSLGSTIVFALMHLPYFYFLGIISGFLSLIPYLGVMLAIVPPVIAGFGHLHSADFLLIAAVVLCLHLLAMNVLYPKVLGKRLRLNPLAVTIALLFWGWLWGAAGLILAVPITGACKIIFDHVERLRPYGSWLGE